MPSSIEKLRAEIEHHEDNRKYREKGYRALFTADARARIMLVGQAPGFQAQEKGRVWDDASGERLRAWLGVCEEQFRDPAIFSVLPMDFYYPGKGTTGDNPPRKGFADLWHPRLLACMPNIQLTILVGLYAQKYYLKKGKKKNLTETVKAYEEYLPEMFPIVHPSPLNFRWLNKNPWFEDEVIPALQTRVQGLIG